jgi:hypothetical protein
MLFRDKEMIRTNNNSFLKYIICIFSLVIVFVPFNRIHPQEEGDWKPSLTEDKLDGHVAATSSLKEKYNPAKAFDRDIRTSWVEGKPDDGIGEKIAFHVSTIDWIRIMPGFGVQKYFKMNNRLKKARISIYETREIAVHQYDTEYSFGKLVKTTILNFKDDMFMQKFYIGITEERKFKPKYSTSLEDYGYIAILEIIEVYRGTRWRDTCIAEIEVVQ